MKSALRRVLCSVVLLCATQFSVAQYYSWGADRASLKWSTIENDRLRIIHPDTTDLIARRMMHYLDAIQQSISCGYEHSALNVPFVVHPDNFVSNGMVMWAPLRVEFLSTPATESYSMPWVKQLTAHEYRHAVQYNNVDRSTIKAISYLLGQQGAALSLLFPPLYALEGDAVLYETLSSSYGRALQPSFTMAYRAMADEILDRRDYLKWRCGSYRQAIPDHYQMGYQMITYANNKYGENILDGIFNYISRNPQFISPYSIALNKYYGTSTKELFYDTFTELTALWEPLSQVKNSGQPLSEKQKGNFITYSDPIALGSGELLALKSDYTDPSRFVLFDTESGDERSVAHTGYVSSRASYAAGRVWWTEYRRSPLFAQYYHSQLCYMDLAQARPKRLKGHKSALYPTPIGESVNHVAYVEYAPSGQYSVVELLDGEPISRRDITYPNEVHSMAWDNLTRRLYIIVTGSEGMWIEQQSGKGFKPLTKPAYITISDLKARDGVLYFGSIASGKDEVHSLDIATGVERQLTQSTYGSFQGVSDGKQLYMTTYDKLGYHLSQQSADESIAEIDLSKLPKNVLNFELPDWDVVNLDTVDLSSADLVASRQEYESERYRRGTHLFNLHSWAPMRFNPLTLLSEMSLDVGLGATLISQNLLSSCEGFLAYGWDHYEGSILQAGVNYDGWGVDLSLSSTYGGEQNVYFLESSQFDQKKYFDVSATATLPLYLYRGYFTNVLSASAGWNFSNGIVPMGLTYQYITDNAGQEEYIALGFDSLRTGLNKLSLGLTYGSYAQAATRDLTTPLGYTLNASYSLDPTNSDFSHLLSLYGKLFTPGLAKNNSFTLAAAYQNAIGGFEIEGYYPLSYVATALIPHGFSYRDVTNNNYLAASAAYKFPLCYPELGVLDFLYIKRLSLGFGADYAQFDGYRSSHYELYSYGVDFMVDLNAISLTSASTLSTTFSLYKPSEGGLYFQFGVSLPF